MKNYLLIVYQSYSPRKHVVYEMSHWLRLGLTAHKHQIKAPHFLFSSKKWHPAEIHILQCGQWGKT
jgi:hypothetical protein